LGEQKSFSAWKGSEKVEEIIGKLEKWKKMIREVNEGKAQIKREDRDAEWRHWHKEPIAIKKLLSKGEKKKLS